MIEVVGVVVVGALVVGALVGVEVIRVPVQAPRWSSGMSDTFSELIVALTLMGSG